MWNLFFWFSSFQNAVSLNGALIFKHKKQSSPAHKLILSSPQKHWQWKTMSGRWNLKIDIQANIENPVYYKYMYITRARLSRCKHSDVVNSQPASKLLEDNDDDNYDNGNTHCGDQNTTTFFLKRKQKNSQTKNQDKWPKKIKTAVTLIHALSSVLFAIKYLRIYLNFTMYTVMSS